jgi:hypothetical protein
MPFLQYIRWVGSLLLVILFAANRLLSGAVVPVPSPDVSLNEKISIRIHSQQNWPERVVFDTTRPTLAPASPVVAETNIRSAQKLAEATRH